MTRKPLHSLVLLCMVGLSNNGPMALQLPALSRNVFVCLSIAGLVFALTAAGPSHAQTDSADQEEDPWSGVEEMLVLGGEGGALGLLEDTGSVTSFDASDLAAYGIENTTDLAAFTPNLEIVQNSATEASFFIRGVGLQDFSANATGAVAVYLNGLPLNSSTLQIAPIFDVQGVEVLKGPQGRGNYRNASAGAILITTRRPDVGAPSFDFSTSQGRCYSHDAIDAYTRRYDFGINIPIVPDILATRFAFQSAESDPLFTNRCAAQPDRPGLSVCGEAPILSSSPTGDGLLGPGLKKQIGNKSVYSMRSSWLLRPPTPIDLEILATFFFSRRDQDGLFGQAIGTGSAGGVALGARTAASDFGIGYLEPDANAEIQDFRRRGLTLREAFRAFGDNFTRTRPLDKRPFEGDFNKNGRVRVEIFGGTLELSAEIGPVELSSTLGAIRWETTNIRDTDFIPNTLFEVSESNRATQYGFDLVARSGMESISLDWELGMYFLAEDLESGSLLDLASIFSDSIRRYEQDTLSLGAFGGFELEFWDDFTLSAGARLNHERKQFAIAQQAIAFAEADDEITWREVTGTVELLYRFSEETSAYVKFNHGFKPGHFNSNGTAIAVAGQSSQRVRDPAKQEVIDSFEVGLNGSYWDGRMHFKCALFHYKYEDYQVFVFEDTPNGPPTLQVINANDARVLGAEIEFQVNPLIGYVPEAIEGLELNLRGGWLDSKFLDFQSTSLLQVGPVTREIVTDFSGNSLLNAPRFQISGGFSWLLDLGRLGEVTPRYDFTWTDDVYFEPGEGRGPARVDGSTLPAFTLGQRGYVLHNVSLAYSPRDSGIKLTGWCRNVLDERVKTYAFDVSRFRGVIINYVKDPRSCGADIAFTW